jgi:hypothetical protein
MLARHFLNICSGSDISYARMQVRESARDIGMNPSDQARISLATSSLMESLGLGNESVPTSLSIEPLCERNIEGLKVTCTFQGSKENKPVHDMASNIKWMVDDIAVNHLANDQIEIILTKWSRGESHNHSK